MANKYEFIGVLIDYPSDFDRDVLSFIRSKIQIEAANISQTDRLTRQRLANSLGIERRRLSRLIKALEITDIFA